MDTMHKEYVFWWFKIPMEMKLFLLTKEKFKMNHSILKSRKSCEYQELKEKIQIGIQIKKSIQPDQLFNDEPLQRD